MDPLIGGSLIGAAGNLLGGLFGASGASAQRRWEENMMNTQYQRTTKDMIAAGLNPMMMYKSGGGPTGGIPTPPNIGEKIGEGISSAAQAAMQYNLNKSLIAAQSASAAQAKALADKTSGVDTDAVRAEIANKQMNTQYQQAQIDLADATRDLQQKLAGKVDFDIGEIKARIAKALSDMDVNAATIKEKLAHVENQNVQTQLLRLSSAKAAVTADAIAGGRTIIGGLIDKIANTGNDIKSYPAWIDAHNKAIESQRRRKLDALGPNFGGVSSARQLTP